MVRFRRKALAVFVIAAIVLLFLAALPQTETAAFADGDVPAYNSSDDVYEISTPAQLKKLAQLVNDCEKTSGSEYYSTLSYVLTADIDLSGVNDWTPIGAGNAFFDTYVDATSAISSRYSGNNSITNNTSLSFDDSWALTYNLFYTEPDGSVQATSTYDSFATYYYLFRIENAFFGSFDGNGHTISGLSYSYSSTYAGLFGRLINANVDNVILQNASVELSGSATNYAGGICGRADNAVINQCGIYSDSEPATACRAYAYAGGICGRMATEEVFSTENIFNSETNGLLIAAVKALLPTEHFGTISSCFSYGQDIFSNGYAGGIVGYCNNANASNCLNGSFVKQVAANQGGGIVGGGESVIESCLGLMTSYSGANITVGALCPYSEHLNCVSSFYLANNPNDARRQAFYNGVDAGASYVTTDKILTARPGEIFVSSSNPTFLDGTYWNAAGNLSGTTYYYPVPKPCTIQFSFTAYKLTSYDGSVTYYDPSYAGYTYPAGNAVSQTGYTLVSWSDGTNTHAFSSNVILTGDLTVTPVWTLNAATVNTSVANLSQEYDGTDHTISFDFSHDIKSSLTPTFFWKKGTEGEFSSSALTVKNVADSDTYYAYVVVTDGVLTSEASPNAQFVINIQPSTYSITITIPPVSGDVKDDVNRTITHVYDGNPISEPILSSSDVCTGHTIDYGTIVYSSSDVTTTTRADIVPVGTYNLSLSGTAILDGESADVTANYASPTVSVYTYVIEYADIECELDTSAHASDIDVTFDGSSHAVIIRNIARKGGEDVYVHVNETTIVPDDLTSVTIGSFTNVTDTTVVFTITADNHNAYVGYVSVKIAKAVITISAADPLPASAIQKTYDGTTVADVSGEYYSVSASGFTVNGLSIKKGETEVARLYKSATYSQAGVGINLDVTAIYSFETGSDNFTFNPSLPENQEDTFSLTLSGKGQIDKKTVTVNQTATLFKVYDGTTGYTGELTAFLEGKYSVGDDGDSATVTPTSGYFNNADAGNVLFIAEFSLDEESKGNYQLSDGITCEVEFGAIITPIQYTIEADDTVFSKTYNRSSAVDLSGFFWENFTIKDVNGDTADFLHVSSTGNNTYSVTVSAGESFQLTITAQYNSASTDATAVIVTFSQDNGNYSLTPTVSYEAHIDPLPIEIKGYETSLSRDYDGTTVVTLEGDMYLDGIKTGDTVGFGTPTGSIDAPDVRDLPYDVTVTAIVLTGADSINYVLSNPSPTGIQITIFPASPIVNPVFKGTRIYDNFGIQNGTIYAYIEDGVLSPISLSEGDTEGEISWVNSSITATGNILYSWTYTPNDPLNYITPTEPGTVTITVEHKTYVSIEVIGDPIKTYTALQPFNNAGIIIRAKLSTNETLDIPPNEPGIEGYTVTYQGERSVFYYGDDRVTISFNGKECVISDIVVQKISVVVPTIGTEVTYTGAARTPSMENIDDKIMTVGGDVSATNKGNYTLTVELKDTNNYEWATETSGSFGWRIKPARRYPLALSATEFTYSGTEKTVSLVNNVGNADSSFYAIDEANSVFSATNAKTYNITVSLVSDNYFWHDPQDTESESNTESLVLSWTIHPQSIRRPVLYNAPYTYNGREQNVSVDRAEEYVLDGDTSFTGAGSYSLTATLNNPIIDGTTYYNYVWTESNTSDAYVMEFSVTPLLVDKPQPAKTLFTYNKSSHSIKLQSTLLYTVTGDLFKTEVGSYRVDVNLVDKVNTCWTDSTTSVLSFSWYITALVVTTPTVIRQNYFTGLEQTAGISYDEQNDNFVLSGYTARDVGSYVARAVLRDKKNYCWSDSSTADKEIPWSILRARVKIPEAPKNMLFTGLEQTCYIETNDAYTIAGNVGKSKGSYTATVTLKDIVGYVWEDDTTDPKVFEWGIYGLSAVSDGESYSMASYELGQSLASPIRSGYTFGGWYTSNDFSESSKVTSLDDITSDTTLYAKWTKKETIVNPDEQPSDKSSGSSSTLSKATKDKLMAGGIVLGACLVAAFFILILGRRKR